jgi:hypothetical protein
LLTWKAGLWRSRLTRRARLQKIRLTRKAGLHRIWLIWKAGLQKIRLIWKTGLCKTQRVGNRKKEKVLLQAKGQLHGGAQGVLQRHNNADCKRCVKESWPRKHVDEERDYWFNRLRPVTKPKQMWQKKRLAKEENVISDDSSGEEEVEVTSAKSDSNPGSGRGNTESGNRNPCRKEDR